MSVKFSLCSLSLCAGSHSPVPRQDRRSPYPSALLCRHPLPSRPLPGAGGDARQETGDAGEDHHRARCCWGGVSTPEPGRSSLISERSSLRLEPRALPWTHSGAPSLAIPGAQSPSQPRPPEGQGATSTGAGSLKFLEMKAARAGRSERGCGRAALGAALPGPGPQRGHLLPSAGRAGPSRDSRGRALLEGAPDSGTGGCGCLQDQR